MDQQSIRHSYPSEPLPPEVLEVTSLEHDNLKTVLAAWTHICDDAAFPTDPRPMLRPIKHLLRHVRLCDVVQAGEDFRFRLLGEAVFPGLTENQKGRLVSEHPDGGIGLRFHTLMRAVVQRRMPVRGLAQRVTQEPRHSYRTETLWLPFGRGAVVEQILSLAAFMPLSER